MRWNMNYSVMYVILSVKRLCVFRKTAKAVAALDVFASLALVAERNHFVRPKTNTTGVIDNQEWPSSGCRADD